MEQALPFPIRDMLQAAKEDVGVSDYHANLVLDVLQASILHSLFPQLPLDPHRMGRDTCYNLYLRQCLANYALEVSIYYEGAKALSEWIHDGYTKTHHASGASKGVLEKLQNESWPQTSSS